jgi:hypothetical protein
VSDWKKWVEEDELEQNRPRIKKVNKNFVCKKNKLGNNKFGPHIYKVNDDVCELCGHVKKEEGEKI